MNVLRHQVSSVHVRGDKKGATGMCATQTKLIIIIRVADRSLVSAPFLIPRSQPRSTHVHARVKAG